MSTNAKKAKKELSALKSNACKLYQKAKDNSPRIDNTFTVSSKYFTGECATVPFAQTLFKLNLNCNLVKLAVFLIILTMLILVTISLRNKIKKCKTR